jgi:hypothetical protein
MYHPLLEDPSKLKDNVLENKILDLSKKYSIAAGMGQGLVCQHIIAALDMYREELSRRQRASLETTIKKSDKGLDDLINVD